MIIVLLVCVRIEIVITILQFCHFQSISDRYYHNKCFLSFPGDDKYGTGLPILTVTMIADTHKRVHIKIVDDKNERWQIPQW